MKGCFTAFALGFGMVYLVKYVIIGLNAWNGFLHPNERENVQSIFAYPLLGIFNPATPMGVPAKGQAY